VDKKTLRAEMRAVGAIDPDRIEAVGRGLFDWLSSRLPGTVSAFLAMPGEVDLAPLFLRLPGWRWVLPRVEPDRSMTFRDRDVPREMHAFGMEQPSDLGPIVPVHEIDVFLTPGLAFDEYGGRLGNGAGFYDEVLGRRRGDAIAVGVTVEAHVVETVPMTEHDQRVDWLATETGVRESSPNR
jgi:5-formyltetrahydrofolate cyclo-ligase